MSQLDAWMPLFVGRYLADTKHLNPAQHGAYLLLLMHYWQNGPLEDDDECLAAIVGIDCKTWRRQIAARVRRFFQCCDGRLVQKRMEIERARAAGISAKRRAAAHASHSRTPPDGGNRGANAPANGGANAPARASQNGANAPANAVSKGANAPALAPLHSTQESNNSKLREESCAREAEATTAQEPDAVGPEATRAVVVSLQKAARMKAYPPRAPVLSRNEQIDEITTPRRARPQPQEPERTLEQQLEILRRMIDAENAAAKPPSEVVAA